MSGVDFAAARTATNSALMLSQRNAQAGTMTLTATNGDIIAGNALLSGGNLFPAMSSGGISYALLQSLANASLKNFGEHQLLPTTAMSLAIWG